MPAYGTNLSPSEVTALVRFLETLKPMGAASGDRYISAGANAAGAARTTLKSKPLVGLGTPSDNRSTLRDYD
jgi:hypothetical protein